MYRLTARLSIGSYRTDFVTSVETEESWRDLTSTATITLPKKLTVSGKPIVDGAKAVFKVGDAVKIELGYDFRFDTVFQGYVANVKTTIPLQLLCEDGMWLMKRFTIKPTAYNGVSVKKLVTDALAHIPAAQRPVAVFSFPDFNLGKFRINNATGAQVLEELRKKYGIQCFFREGKLYVGFAYSHSNKVKDYQKVVPLSFTENIIEDDLLFKSKDERKIKIVATGFAADNKQFTKEAGDPDGQAIPLFFPGKSPSEVQALATDAAKKYDFAGLEGDFTTFGRPFVRQGDAVKLVDSAIPERSGTYLVEKVARSFGADGYRQAITIDRKVG